MRGFTDIWGEFTDIRTEFMDIRGGGSSQIFL